MAPESPRWRSRPWLADVKKRPQIRLDPENPRNGIMQLVLTVVELLRDLLERQALRRIEAARSARTKRNGSA